MHPVGWLVLSVWIGAAVLAVVVLGFCGHELYWKLRRLRADLARLNETADRLRTLQGQAAALAEEGTRLHGGPAGA